MTEGGQTHCLLDCFSYALQTGEAVYDDRPLYFGAWQAPIDVTEQGVSYYSRTVGYEAFVRQFEQLYGKSVRSLLDYGKDKPRNYIALHRQMKDKARDLFVLALVDLYYLPYPNQCFGVRHRPHIVIVDRRTETGCFLIDPFFSWEGDVPLHVFQRSFYYEDLGMCLLFDKRGVHDPERAAVARLFAENDFFAPCELIAHVETFIEQAMAEEAGRSLDSLFPSIEQTGVVARRWNAYRKAFSYFAEILRLPAAPYLESVAALMGKWEGLILSVVRIGILGKRSELHRLQEKIRQIGELEFSIRRQLESMYEQWVRV